MEVTKKSFRILGLQFAIRQAIKGEGMVGEVARQLREPHDFSIDNETCCLLADLLEVKRKRGRPKIRRDGFPTVNQIAVMHRFAWNCANIGREGGPLDRGEAKAEVCKAFGICQRDFETIHGKDGHYAADFEKRYKEIDDQIRKELAGDDPAK